MEASPPAYLTSSCEWGALSGAATVFATVLAMSALRPAPVRVAVVEDDADYREGLTLLFEHTPGHELAAVFEDAADAVAAAEAGAAAGWDLVLMDVEMPRL